MGERDTRYSTNVDTLINVVKIHNLVVGPFFDNAGRFKGVVQLINKNMQGEIDQTDIHQIDTLLPVIGEILTSAEDSLKVMNLAAGLNDHETRELATLVVRLAKEWGMAILLVEHDINFVMSVCDDITVLDFGTRISPGTPAEVRADPAVISAYLGVQTA
jgi:ABC-type uncharacterized transport system ATPase subunit